MGSRGEKNGASFQVNTTNKTTSALVVIDLQVGVIDGGWDGQGVLQRTNTLIERARAEHVPVIFVQHEEEEMPRDSDLWQIAPPLTPLASEPRVFKTHRDSFADTTLRNALSELNVTRLVIAGAQSDYCIRTTTQRAASDGYDVVLVSDCHTTADAEYDGVTITGEQIVAHTNLYFSGLTYPNQTTTIAPHTAVEFTAQ